MARGKKDNVITLDTIIKDADSYDKLKKIRIDAGVTEIYTNFSNSRIDEMLESFGGFIGEYSKHNKKLIESKVIDYLNLHILLYFTTITDRTDFTYAEKSDVFEKIIKSRISEMIFDQFDKNDIGKCFERVFKKLETQKELINANVDIREQLIKQIEESDMENKDTILKVMFNKTGENIETT